MKNRDASRIKQLHDEAMRHAEQLVTLRKQDVHPLVLKMTAEVAADLEAQAAALVPEGVEPTRSVLYRSAANLARDAGNIKLARKYATRGLAGKPPPEITAELKQLLADTLGPL